MSSILVLGDLNLDVHVQQVATPLPGHELRNRVSVAPGGSAGTFARQAAAAGANVLFVGSVGTDSIGDLLEQSLHAAGVRTHLRRVAHAASGAVVALVMEDERSMICSRGANDGLTADWLDDTLFTGIDHVHLSGYMFLSPEQVSAAVWAGEQAASLGLSVSVDPPPANLISGFGLQDFLELLPASCWLFPNLAEGRLLAEEDAPQEIVERLSTTFPIGALTMGAEGAITWDPSSRQHQSVDTLRCADSTGAGDAFAGTFVAEYLAHRNLDEATQEAIGAARKLLQSRD